MPYITKEERDNLYGSPSTVGQLNYLLTRVAKSYFDLKGESYQTYNDIIGALECCKLEIYRRKVAYYEDDKKAANGDVW